MDPLTSNQKRRLHLIKERKKDPNYLYMLPFMNYISCATKPIAVIIPFFLCNVINEKIDKPNLHNRKFELKFST